MTVYIEYVIADNFFFTYVICALSYAVMKEKVKKLRCAVASAFGTAVAVFYPFVKSTVWVLIIKFALFLVLCIILYAGLKHCLIHSATFLLCTAVVGGIQFMIGFIVFGNAYAALTRPISELPLSLFFLPPLVIFLFAKRIIDKINDRRLKGSFIYDINLTVCDKSKKVRGFVDTGNNVRAQNDVVFISSLTALDILGMEYFKLIETDRSVVVHTAAGDKKIILLPGKVELYTKDEHIFMDVQVGISEIRSDEYEALLPLSVLKKELG